MKIAIIGAGSSYTPEIIEGLDDQLHQPHRAGDRSRHPLYPGEHRRAVFGWVIPVIEAEVFRAYADETQDTKPAALAKRGGGGYSEVAWGVIDALYNDRDKTIIVNIAKPMLDEMLVANRAYLPQFAG